MNQNLVCDIESTHRVTALSICLIANKAVRQSDVHVPLCSNKEAETLQLFLILLSNISNI
jgi:hypothetical protein